MPFYNEINNIYNFAISFSKNPWKDFAIFARGYFHAASKLAEELLSKGRVDSDYDAYPIVFLYRHSLELYLKQVLYKSALLMAFKRMENLDSKLRFDHNLIYLSKRVVAILENVFPDVDDIKRLSEKILRISSEFSEIDTNSFAYRYPINKKEELSTKPHQIVNLEAFSSKMNELLDELETLDFGFDIELSKAQDIYEILEELEKEGSFDSEY
jgi:hypothetical protein